MAATLHDRSALAELRRVSIPRLSADDWTVGDAKVGLRELARLRAELTVAQTVLVRVMSAETGRDTAATLSRNTGMSGREAREATKVAEVVESLPGAEEALASGAVTSSHLAALAPVASTDDAASLLELAASQSPEEFAKSVQRVRIERDVASWSEKQRASRSLRFFTEEYGCVGIRGVLPPVAGAEVKAVLNRIADDAWRAEHPERADILGGHDAEPYERRLADALITLAQSHGETKTSDPCTEATPGRRQQQSSSNVRPTVVVTIDAETLESEIIGEGPIPFTDAADLAARADVYAAIHDSNWAILNFGRNRRLATRLQRLAIIVRDRQCVTDGCTIDYRRCDVHHEPPFEDGGRTDVDAMELECTCEHHPHRHTTGQPSPKRRPAGSQKQRAHTNSTSQLVTAQSPRLATGPDDPVVAPDVNKAFARLIESMAKKRSLDVTVLLPRRTGRTDQPWELVAVT